MATKVVIETCMRYFFLYSIGHERWHMTLSFLRLPTYESITHTYWWIRYISDLYSQRKQFLLHQDMTKETSKSIFIWRKIVLYIKNVILGTKLIYFLCKSFPLRSILATSIPLESAAKWPLTRSNLFFKHSARASHKQRRAIKVVPGVSEGSCRTERVHSNINFSVSKLERITPRRNKLREKLLWLYLSQSKFCPSRNCLQKPYTSCLTTHIYRCNRRFKYSSV